jgi:pimeloyl-ACP methyl ester carboxylesterase
MSSPESITIARVFPASADYRLQVSPDAHVFFEDSRPNATPGTTVAICLPGIGDTRRQFRLLAPLLHDRLGFRVLLGDLRGFGDSSASFPEDKKSSYPTYSPESVASDVTKLMTELSAADSTCSFVLLGNSLSAASMVLAAASDATESSGGPRVRGLVLLGPILRDSPMDSWFRPLSHLLFRSLYGAWVWAAYYKTLFPGKLPADFDAELAILKTHLNSQPGNIVNVGRFMRASKVGVAATLAALGEYPTMPVLAFVGRKDPDYADVSAEIKWVAESVPHAHVFEDEEGGHYPHLENPERVLKAIAESLHSTDSA